MEEGREGKGEKIGYEGEEGYGEWRRVRWGVGRIRGI